ncbi:hypothetical protein [Listeria phage P100plus]|nr:hypothetical protein QLX35_gp050 [Listeria phage LP-125]YP_009592579.1 hypothetical protein FDG78_gp050 [Listeria phage LP-064]YP_406515.1 gp139 [Listeria phage P100]QIG60780.1 hypothetical protein vBLinoVEfB7_037 [Listeria phage vB_Lino_VEfB7]QJB22408.1 hypothetical protein [Listeria phage P100plus]QJB22598.1 hypothetical protein [Listeria phage P200]QKN84235.1 hypothetical protein [Listeria virus P61]QNL31993.1 hypothetical protein HUK30_0031 [Listeria phage LP-Mix_6.2]
MRLSTVCGVAFLVLLILQLTGFINIVWWTVFIPIIIWVVIVVFVWIVILFLIILAILVDFISK